MRLITSPEAAARLARTIVYDILLYNKDRIEEGIKKDSLFELLREEIEQGERLYRSRVAPDIVNSTNFYNRALVDILVKKSGNIESSIW